MLFDLFPFHNELELLKLRLEEYSDIVDYFVILECPKTHSGLDKPLYYLNNKHLFESYNHKIRHVLLEESSLSNDPWTNEKMHFNRLTDGISDAKASDLLMIGAVDEFPNKKLVAQLKTSYNRPESFGMHFCTNYMNISYRHWHGTVITSLEHLNSKFGGSPSRTTYDRQGGKIPVIPWKGQHFCYIGSPEAMKHKVDSSADFGPGVASLEKIKEDVKNLNYSIASIQKSQGSKRLIDRGDLPMSVQNHWDELIAKGYIYDGPSF